MSSSFMFMIGIFYLAAATTFALEDKWMWSLVALSWAVGNLAIAWMTK